MSLFQLKADYQAGLISKPSYIDAMHRLHAGLFDYAEFIRDTDIARIEVTDGTVVMTSRRTGIKLLCDPQDSADGADRDPQLRGLRAGGDGSDVTAHPAGHDRVRRGRQHRLVQPEHCPADARRPGARVRAAAIYLRLSGAQCRAQRVSTNIHLHNFGFSHKADKADCFTSTRKAPATRRRPTWAQPAQARDPLLRSRPWTALSRRPG